MVEYFPVQADSNRSQAVDSEVLRAMRWDWEHLCRVHQGSTGDACDPKGVPQWCFAAVVFATKPPLFLGPGIGLNVSDRTRALLGSLFMQVYGWPADGLCCQGFEYRLQRGFYQGGSGGG